MMCDMLAWRRTADLLVIYDGPLAAQYNGNIARFASPSFRDARDGLGFSKPLAQAECWRTGVFDFVLVKLQQRPPRARHTAAHWSAGEGVRRTSILDQHSTIKVRAERDGCGVLASRPGGSAGSSLDG